MGLVQKGEPDDNPHIPENYYLCELSGVNSYDRDSDAMGIVMRFRVDTSDESDVASNSVELPFFAPAKLSISRDRESSRLAENLENLGLLQPVLQELGVEEQVMSEKHKWIASSDKEFENLKTILKAVFADKVIRVNVEDSQDGDSSQVRKFSRVFEPDERGESSDSEGNAEDVLFGDEDEAGSEEDVE